MASTTKDDVIEMIRRLPDDASLADIMAELYVRQKIEAGLQELDRGQGIDHAAAKQRLVRHLA